MIETKTPAADGTAAGGIRSKASNGCDPNRPQCQDHEPVVSGTTTTKDTHSLAQIAGQIKALEKKTIQNVVEIGRLLQEVDDQCEHGEYMKWLKGEFGWSHGTSLNYRNVYALSQNRKICDFDKLDISISALYMIARLSKGARQLGSQYSEAAVEAIIGAAKHGRVSYRMACDILERLRPKGDDLSLGWELAPEPDPPADSTEPSPPEDATSDDGATCKDVAGRITKQNKPLPPRPVLRDEFTTVVNEWKQSMEAGDITVDDVQWAIGELRTLVP
jgi:Protein of unknown function (DUF3102)